jgi:hypothetical protein
MSEKMKKMFGPFWIVQFLIIGTLLFYSLIVTSGIILLMGNESSSIVIENDDTLEKVVITLLFISNVPENPITWQTIVKESKVNSTLFEVMNSTLNLTIEDYGPLGVLVTGINSIKNDGVNFWTYDYYVVDKGWVRAPIGVSYFILTRSFVFRWNFGPVN